MKAKCIIVGKFQVNCYLYIDEKSKRVVIIDPGWEADRIISFIEKSNLTPVSILLTHAHSDHIGALLDIREKYNLPTVIFESDDEMLADARRNGTLVFFRSPTELHADILLSDGDYYDPFGGVAPLRVIHTPGHTIGSACFYSESLNMVFAGDTMFKLSVAINPDSDIPAQLDSIKTKLLTLPDFTGVLPGHGPPTTIGLEKKNNPYFKNTSY